LAILTVLAFAATSMAQQPPSVGPVPEKAKLEKFRGTIGKVDEAAKSIEVTRKEQTLAFATDEKTKIMLAKKVIPFADLKQGMRANVKYKKDGEKMIAVAIHASIPRAKKEKPAEEKK
jgi:hypothetical protein